LAINNARSPESKNFVQLVNNVPNFSGGVRGVIAGKPDYSGSE
jgi:hypothetical protein